MARLVTARGLAWLNQVELGGETQAVLRRLITALEAIDAEATAADAVVRARAQGDRLATAVQTLEALAPEWR